MKKLLITIPCYNEELILHKSVLAILHYAQERLKSYDWKLMILDNASTDATWRLAQELKSAYGHIELAQCLHKGRGAAIRTVWQETPGYDIYSYMDSDLATDLKDFKRLVDEVGKKYYIVVGSRYIRGSRIRRSVRREFLSRIYNMLLKAVLKVDFRDAQCGFKAFSAQIVKNIVPLTEDNGWFWDTELMILARRKGYKILEIPVAWEEVRDELRTSKVSPIAETIRQLKNIYMLKKRMRTARGPH